MKFRFNIYVMLAISYVVYALNSAIWDEKDYFLPYAVLTIPIIFNFIMDMLKK